MMRLSRIYHLTTPPFPMWMSLERAIGSNPRSLASPTKRAIAICPKINSLLYPNPHQVLVTRLHQFNVCLSVWCEIELHVFRVSTYLHLFIYFLYIGSPPDIFNEIPIEPQLITKRYLSSKIVALVQFLSFFNFTLFVMVYMYLSRYLCLLACLNYPILSHPS